jgi:hypothetical protein
MVPKKQVRCTASMSYDTASVGEERVGAASSMLICVEKGRPTVSMLRVLSRRGDDRITWDSQKVNANDSEAVAAIREAERIFSDERKKGATAFKVESGHPVERIEKFDGTAEQIILVPRVVGG